MSIDRLLVELTGKKPTDEELRRLYVIAKHLNVDPNDDAIMALYASLEWYNGIFSEIPGKIKAASDEAAATAMTRINNESASLKAKFDAYMQKAANKAVAGMVDAVKETASAATTTNNILWIVVCSGIIALVFAVILIFGAIKIQDRAFDSGFKAGVADAANVELILQKRDEFTKTDAFNLAQAYDEHGLLLDILECQRPGWKIEEKQGKRYCIPYMKRDGNGNLGASPWEIPELN